MNTPAELAIRDSIHKVESYGAGPEITEVVTLLSQALEKLHKVTDEKFGLTNY